MPLTVHDLDASTKHAQIIVRTAMAAIVAGQTVYGRTFKQVRNLAMKTQGWQILSMINLRYRCEIDRLAEMPAYTTLEELTRWSR